MPASFSSSTYTPDQLLVGDKSPVSRQITLASGNLLRGTVLGKITANGNYIQSLAAAGDGSQTPDCILAEDTDASGGAKTTVAFFSADVNENKVILGAGHTLASVREGLRAKDIHLITAKTAV